MEVDTRPQTMNFQGSAVDLPVSLTNTVPTKHWSVPFNYSRLGRSNVDYLDLQASRYDSCVDSGQISVIAEQHPTNIAAVLSLANQQSPKLKVVSFGEQPVLKGSVPSSVTLAQTGPHLPWPLLHQGDVPAPAQLARFDTKLGPDGTTEHISPTQLAASIDETARSMLLQDVRDLSQPMKYSMQKAHRRKPCLGICEEVGLPVGVASLHPVSSESCTQDSNFLAVVVSHMEGQTSRPLLGQVIEDSQSAGTDIKSHTPSSKLKDEDCEDKEVHTESKTTESEIGRSDQPQNGDAGLMPVCDSGAEKQEVKSEDKSLDPAVLKDNRINVTSTNDEPVYCEQGDACHISDINVSLTKETSSPMSQEQTRVEDTFGEIYSIDEVTVALSEHHNMVNPAVVTTCVGESPSQEAKIHETPDGYHDPPVGCHSNRETIPAEVSAQPLLTLAAGSEVHTETVPILPDETAEENNPLNKEGIRSALSWNDKHIKMSPTLTLDVEPPTETSINGTVEFPFPQEDIEEAGSVSHSFDHLSNKYIVVDAMPFGMMQPITEVSEGSDGEGEVTHVFLQEAAHEKMSKHFKSEQSVSAAAGGGETFVEQISLYGRQGEETTSTMGWTSTSIKADTEWKDDNRSLMPSQESTDTEALVRKETPLTDKGSATEKTSTNETSNQQALQSVDDSASSVSLPCPVCLDVAIRGHASTSPCRPGSGKLSRESAVDGRCCSAHIHTTKAHVPTEAQDPTDTDDPTQYEIRRGVGGDCHKTVNFDISDTSTMQDDSNSSQVSSQQGRHTTRRIVKAKRMTRRKRAAKSGEFMYGSSIDRKKSPEKKTVFVKKTVETIVNEGLRKIVPIKPGMIQSHGVAMAVALVDKDSETKNTNVEHQKLFTEGEQGGVKSEQCDVTDGGTQNQQGINDGNDEHGQDITDCQEGQESPEEGCESCEVKAHPVDAAWMERFRVNLKRTSQLMIPPHPDPEHVEMIRGMNRKTRLCFLAASGMEFPSHPPQSLLGYQKSNCGDMDAMFIGPGSLRRLNSTSYAHHRDVTSTQAPNATIGSHLFSPKSSGCHQTAHACECILLTTSPQSPKCTTINGLRDGHTADAGPRRSSNKSRSPSLTGECQFVENTTCTDYLDDTKLAEELPNHRSRRLKLVSRRCKSAPRVRSEAPQQSRRQTGSPGVQRNGSSAVIGAGCEDSACIGDNIHTDRTLARGRQAPAKNEAFLRQHSSKQQSANSTSIRMVRACGENPDSQKLAKANNIGPYRGEERDINAHKMMSSVRCTPLTIIIKRGPRPVDTNVNKVPEWNSPRKPRRQGVTLTQLNIPGDRNFNKSLRQNPSSHKNRGPNIARLSIVEDYQRDKRYKALSRRSKQHELEILRRKRSEQRMNLFMDLKSYHDLDVSPKETMWHTLPIESSHILRQHLPPEEVGGHGEGHAPDGTTLEPNQQTGENNALDISLEPSKIQACISFEDANDFEIYDYGGDVDGNVSSGSDTCAAMGKEQGAVSTCNETEKLRRRSRGGKRGSRKRSRGNSETSLAEDAEGSICSDSGRRQKRKSKKMRKLQSSVFETENEMTQENEKTEEERPGEEGQEEVDNSNEPKASLSSKDNTQGVNEVTEAPEASKDRTSEQEQGGAQEQPEQSCKSESEKLSAEGTVVLASVAPTSTGDEKPAVKEDAPVSDKSKRKESINSTCICRLCGGTRTKSITKGFRCSRVQLYPTNFSYTCRDIVASRAVPCGPCGGKILVGMKSHTQPHAIDYLCDSVGEKKRPALQEKQNAQQGTVSGAPVEKPPQRFSDELAGTTTVRTRKLAGGTATTATGGEKGYVSSGNSTKEEVATKHDTTSKEKTGQGINMKEEVTNWEAYCGKQKVGSEKYGMLRSPVRVNHTFCGDQRDICCEPHVKSKAYNTIICGGQKENTKTHEAVEQKEGSKRVSNEEASVAESYPSHRSEPRKTDVKTGEKSKGGNVVKELEEPPCPCLQLKEWKQYDQSTESWGKCVKFGEECKDYEKNIKLLEKTQDDEKNVKPLEQSQNYEKDVKPGEKSKDNEKDIKLGDKTKDGGQDEKLGVTSKDGGQDAKYGEKSKDGEKDFKQQDELASDKGNVPDQEKRVESAAESNNVADNELPPAADVETSKENDDAAPSVTVGDKASEPAPEAHAVREPGVETVQTSPAVCFGMSRAGKNRRYRLGFRTFEGRDAGYRQLTPSAISPPRKHWLLSENSGFQSHYQQASSEAHTAFEKAKSPLERLGYMPERSDYSTMNTNSPYRWKSDFMSSNPWNATRRISKYRSAVTSLKSQKRVSFVSPLPSYCVASGGDTGDQGSQEDNSSSPVKVSSSEPNCEKGYRIFVYPSPSDETPLQFKTKLDCPCEASHQKRVSNSRSKQETGQIRSILRDSKTKAMDKVIVCENQSGDTSHGGLGTRLKFVCCCCCCKKSGTSPKSSKNNRHRYRATNQKQSHRSIKGGGSSRKASPNSCKCWCVCKELTQPQANYPCGDVVQENGRYDITSELYSMGFKSTVYTGDYERVAYPHEEKKTYSTFHNPQDPQEFVDRDVPQSYSLQNVDISDNRGLDFDYSCAPSLPVDLDPSLQYSYRGTSLFGETHKADLSRSRLTSPGSREAFGPSQTNGFRRRLDLLDNNYPSVSSGESSKSFYAAKYTRLFGNAKRRL